MKRPTDGAGELAHALNAERAATMGKLGRAVERTLAAFRRSEQGKDRDARTTAAYACAEAVWHYFVQRETMGLVDHTAVIEHYRIPDEVLAKVGARQEGP